MILALVACVVRNGSGDGPATISDEPPQITALTLDCKTEWALHVATANWTGGGHLYIGRDATSIESHAVYSVEAAADGTTDTLELELEIVADFRDVELGSSTAWLCSEEKELSYLVTVQTADGEERADCRTWGVAPAIFDEAIGGCDTPLGDTGD